MDANRPLSTDRGRLSRQSCAIIAIFGSIIFLVNFGPSWALTYHEAFFAEPAREMLRTGDWLIPRVMGVPAWQKPPLTHWLIAGSMALFHTEAEWAVRLPTLFATLFNALFVAAIAARWLGDRVGRYTGLIQLTTFYALFMGRLAESDMLLCAAVSGGMYALSLAVNGEGGRWSRLGYFFAAGISSMVKGPVGPVILGGAGFCLALLERKKIVWKTLFDPLGLTLLAVLGLLWPIAAYRVDPTILDALRVHNLDRFTGTYDGHENPFFYLYIIPSILLPWTPFVVAGLILLRKKKDRPEGPWKLLICWTAVGLALIQLSAWKHKHYPMPMLAPASILAAYALSQYLKNADRNGRSPARLFSIILAGVGLAGILAGGVRDNSLVMFVGFFGIIAAIGLAIAFWLRRSGRIEWTPTCLFATIGLIVVLNQSYVMPKFDIYRPQAELARRTNGKTPTDVPLCLVEIPSPQIVFYLRHPLKRFDTREAFTRWVEASDKTAPLYVMGPKLVAERIERLGASEVLDRADALTQITVLKLRPEAEKVAIEAKSFSSRR